MEEPRMDEAEIQREAVYLHEAGHAVVALNFGFTVNTVTCDGVVGAVDKEPDPAAMSRTQDALARRGAGELDAAQYCEVCFNASWPELLVNLGGIAGESLESGRVISGVRRSADDLATFFGRSSWIVQALPVEDRDALLLEKFCRALEEARFVIQRRQLAVRAVAEALKTSPTLTGQQVIDLIRPFQSETASSPP
jgi:hypothetical protein